MEPTAYDTIRVVAMPRDPAPFPFPEAETTQLPGYSADDIPKILGGNLLRVFRETERVSREMQRQAPESSAAR
jgi:hypothetical protein